MSILFADIYDGIRAIRISKGVCERDILNYVQEKAGGCMKVGNVLKTIRTLKKLVDDGQLLKKGNRYCFPPKDECEKEEGEEEDEEEEMGDEDNGDELDMEPDECDEGDDDEEEEEEEDDDDEDEEEDDDDEEEEEEEEDEDEDEEEDESCNENEAGATGAGDSQSPEVNGKSPDNPAVSPNQGEPDCTKVQKATDDVSYSQNGISQAIESNTKNNVRKTVKDKNILDQDKGETIAFCARDFIDSLAESKSERDSEEKIETSKATERVMKMPKRFSTSAKKSQPPRKKSNVERFRSRSPLHGRKRNFSLIGQDISYNLGFTGAEKDILGGSINSKMEIDTETEAGDFGVAQKSPPRDSPMTEVQMELQEEKDRRNALAESGLLNRKGSSDHLMENIPKEALKLMQLKSASYSNMVWYPLEDSDNAQDIIHECTSFESSNVVAKKDSMCSICEKKKRIS